MALRAATTVRRVTGTDALYLPDGDRFVATDHTVGGWYPNMQSGGAVLPLLGHHLDGVPTLAPMGLTRLTVDLVRPVPIGPPMRCPR